ncbi:MAG: hypothetical protein Q4E62_07015 [Sutterellaceae bacterium]|nr:hypothetical protein [Sutterellaceae bacterium]
MFTTKEAVAIHTKRAKLVANQFLELYGPSQVVPDENADGVISKCHQSFVTIRTGLQKRMNGNTDEPHLAQYVHEPLRIELAGKSTFCQQLLMLTEEFDKTLRFIETAWIQGFITIRDHGEMMRSLEGRIFSTARRVHRRLSAA